MVVTFKSYSKLFDRSDSEYFCSDIKGGIMQFQKTVVSNKKLSIRWSCRYSNTRRKHGTETASYSAYDSIPSSVIIHILAKTLLHISK